MVPCRRRLREANGPSHGTHKARSHERDAELLTHRVVTAIPPLNIPITPANGSIECCTTKKEPHEQQAGWSRKTKCSHPHVFHN